MRVILIFVGVVVALIALGWLGLQVKPAPFAAYSQPQPKLETVLLPRGLPTPVERFYRKVYGENIPVIKSAVITGRATMRPTSRTSRISRAGRRCRGRWSFPP